MKRLKFIFSLVLWTIVHHFSHCHHACTTFHILKHTCVSNTVNDRTPMGSGPTNLELTSRKCSTEDMKWMVQCFSYTEKYNTKQKPWHCTTKTMYASALSIESKPVSSSYKLLVTSELPMKSNVNWTHCCTQNHNTNCWCKHWIASEVLCELTTDSLKHSYICQ